MECFPASESGETPELSRNREKVEKLSSRILRKVYEKANGLSAKCRFCARNTKGKSYVCAQALFTPYRKDVIRYQGPRPMQNGKFSQKKTFLPAVQVLLNVTGVLEPDHRNSPFSNSNTVLDFSSLLRKISEKKR